MNNTPGQILTSFLSNHGFSEFTVEPIDSDTGLLSGAVDLGNGNQVFDFISQMTDSVYCTPGEEIDMASCNFQDWDNLSRLYTGQWGGGTSMHDSEYVGGKLAEQAHRLQADAREQSRV